MSHSPKIIFNADDFGRSAIANKNILDLAKRDKIQRVSVMVNKSFSKTEVNELLESKVKLDLHLTIPRLAANHKSQATDTIYRSVRFIFLYLTGRIKPNKIEIVWQGQIKNFRKIFGRIPDGLNSHEHVHFFPPYFKIALKLCKKYTIPYIRFGSKGIVSFDSNIGQILKLLNRTNKKLFAAYGSRPTGMPTTCDYLLSFDWAKNYNLNSLIELEKYDKNVTEVVCHPEKKEEYEKVKNFYARLKAR